MAATGAFAFGLNTPFVFDDQHAIAENLTIRQLWPPTRALWEGPPQAAVAGRPIPNLTLAINYAVNGTSPFGYHLFNLVVHLLAATTLFAIVRRSVARVAGAGQAPSAEVVAFAAAGLWSVHPVNSEVVSYVTQRTESLMALFFLVTLYASIRAMEEPADARRWTMASVAACAAGMLCKETMVVAPVLVLLYDRTFVAPGFAAALRRRRMLYIGLAASWLVLLIVIVGGPRWRSAGFASGVSAWTYLLNQAEMVVAYLRLAVWPRHLVLDYGIPRHLTVASAALPLALVIALFATVGAAWWRGWSVAAFLGTWFFLTLAPTSSFVPIATEVGAERRMYLALAAITTGAALVLAYTAHRWAGGSARPSGLATGGVTAVLIAALAAGTIARTREYETPIRIWQTVVDRRPHGRAHLNLGVALQDAGHHAAARRHFEIALPEAPGAHYGLAFEFQNEGRYDEAAAHYQEYLRLRGDDVTAIRARHQLARVYFAQKRFDEAATEFRGVLRMQRGHVDALAGLADTLMELSRYEEAIAAYRDYLSIRPGIATVHANLGVALAAVNREAEAAREFERALAVGPPDAGIHQNAAFALAAVGRLDEAVSHLERAIRLAPGSARLFSHLGATLVAAGRRDDASAAFRRAFELAPDDPQVHADFQMAQQAIATVSPGEP